MSFLINPYRFAAAGATDPNFSNVSLLLHGDGTNGSTTITDSSGSPKTVTAVGNAQISTAQSKFGGASIAFDGTGDYLTVPAGSDFSFPGDFTVETFLYLNGTPGVYDTITEIGTYLNGILFRVNGTANGYDIIINGTANRIDVVISGNPVSQWVHLALTRSGSTVRLFVEGTLRGSTTATGTVNSTSGTTRIGFEKDGTSGRELNGYLDEFRITKGVARYTANFTPPTAPFPNS
jgi:hypothetical protein